uniref:Cadherin domain-containing protein n=1 Tax=Ciona savignyi TaxID=51511 RepID=H2ZGL7_CIOSA
MFPPQPYSVSIGEDTPIGSTITVVTATDSDRDPDNTRFYYSLKGNTVMNLTVEVSDNGLPPRSSRVSIQIQLYDRDSFIPKFKKDVFKMRDARNTTTVVIDVEDSNDHDPMFTETSYRVEMSESTPVGGLVIQIHAEDEDAGNNGSVFYTLLGNPDKFTIDPINGTITTTQTLDYDLMRTSYKLRVRASDRGTPFSRKSECFVFVTISNMNDNAPMFDESDCEILINIHIPEDTAVGTSVTKVQAFDRDHGFNGKLWFTITDGNSDSCFSIDTENGAVSVVKPLDRERTSSYNLTVSISDLGSPSKTSSARIFISVTDINDNAPYFGQTHYAFRLRENVRVGFVIQQNIWATDHDVGRNANITYSLSSAMGGEKFSINKTTGFIKVIEGLDRESTSEYRLTVTATDGGKIPLSSSALVLIDVTDVNDNPPRFHQSIFRIKVTEDLPVGTVVFRLQSSDPDSPENSVVRYSLTAGVSNRAHAGEPKFNVDPRTGYIRISAGLDYRLKTRYNITARARDSNYRVATCYIEVEVVPVNRNLNAPYFDLPEVKFDVLENAAIGVTVGIATAVDEDITQPENSSGYSIVDGTGLGIFNIDENTGWFTL